jgi:hypothetical protein
VDRIHGAHACDFEEVLIRQLGGTGQERFHAPAATRTPTPVFSIASDLRDEGTNQC